MQETLTWFAGVSSRLLLNEKDAQKVSDVLKIPAEIMKFTCFLFFHCIWFTKLLHIVRFRYGQDDVQSSTNAA